MVSYPYVMPSGIPGNITRPEQYTVEAAIISSSNTPAALGLPVKLVNGQIQSIVAGDVSSVIAGFLVRPFPTQSSTNTFGSAVPVAGAAGNLLRRGYLSVNLGGTAAAVKGAPVYVRVGNPSSGKVIGDVEAASDLSVAGVANVGNTGNGTIGSLSMTSTTPTGVYLATLTSATKYNVTDASGEILGAGTVGTQETLDNGLSLKLTAGGTAFAANDGFTITVTDNTILVPGNSWFMGPADANGNAELGFNI